MTFPVVPEGWSRIREGAVPEGLNTPCWVWQTKPNAGGYATTCIGSKTTGTNRKVYAHRLVYEALVGVVPPGMELDHLCRARNCVNPDHLEAVTHAENVRRGTSPAALHSKKIACPQGHPYEGDNLTRTPQGHRRCRECDRVKARRHYWSKR